MSISLSSQIDPFTCCLNSLLARIAAKLYRATPVFTPLTIVQAIYQFGILPEWDLQLDQYLSLDWLRDTLTIWRSNVETGPSQLPSPIYVEALISIFDHSGVIVVVPHLCWREVLKVLPKLAKITQYFDVHIQNHQAAKPNRKLYSWVERLLSL